MATLKPRVVTRASVRASSVSWQAIRAIAEFTFWLDEVVGKVAGRLFSALPETWQYTLKRRNDQFKSLRNAALGVETLYNVPREKHSADASMPSNPISSPNQTPSRFDGRSRPDLPQLADQRGDVPGWVLVVLMTTGLVTALWTIAAPRLSQILRNSLDSMNSIR